MPRCAWRLFIKLKGREVRIEKTNNTTVKVAVLKDVDDYGNVEIFDKDLQEEYVIQRPGIICIVPLQHGQTTLESDKEKGRENGRERESVSE